MMCAQGSTRFFVFTGGTGGVDASHAAVPTDALPEAALGANHFGRAMIIYKKGDDLRQVVCVCKSSGNHVSTTTASSGPACSADVWAHGSTAQEGKSRPQTNSLSVGKQ